MSAEYEYHRKGKLPVYTAGFEIRQTPDEGISKMLDIMGGFIYYDEEEDPIFDVLKEESAEDNIQLSTSSEEPPKGSSADITQYMTEPAKKSILDLIV